MDIDLSERDSGKVVEVEPGDRLRLVLSAPDGDGGDQRWDLVEVDDDILHLTNRSDDPRPPGHTEILEFTAHLPGETHLELVSQHRLHQAAEPAARLVVQVVVLTPR